ncbi:MAG: hypothetical protein WAK92_05565, partial [Thiobacillus sp.]
VLQRRISRASGANAQTDYRAASHSCSPTAQREGTQTIARIVNDHADHRDQAATNLMTGR